MTKKQKTKNDNKYIEYIDNLPADKAIRGMDKLYTPPKPTPGKNKDLLKRFSGTDLQMIRAQKMALNYKEFIKGAWHTVEPKGEFMDNWHIDAICDVVQAVINDDNSMRNVIINIPPRHSKTRIVSDLLVPWVWIRDPWMRFLYASYAEDLSIISSRYCKAVLQSKWYQDRWADEYKLTAAKDKDITNNIAGYRRIKSVAAGVTGQGGHVIVADDVLKAQDAFSDQMRNGCNTWYDNAFSNRIEGGVIAEGKRIIIMQRLHDNDLTGYILANESVYKWYHLNLPVEYIPDKKCIIKLDGNKIFEDPRKKAGEILHPERFGKPEVDAERGKGSYHFSSQYLQDPVPEGGGIVKADWIFKNIYHDNPTYWYENCPKLIQSWDLSFSGGNDADYVVGQLWGQKKNDIYLIDQTRARMNFPATLAAITQMKMIWPRTQQIIIEKKANGQGIIDTLKGRVPGIIPYDPESKDKTERLSMVSWMIEAGHVHFPDPEKYSWVLDAIVEITRFPAAPYDDIVDALSQALKKMELISFSPDNGPHGLGTSRTFTKNWRAGDIVPLNHERPWNRNWSA